MKAIVVTLIYVQLLQVPGSASDGPVAESAYIERNEVYVVLRGSDQARRITNDGTRKGYLVVSGDGRRVAFARETGGDELADIMVAGADGSGAREIHFRPSDAHISGMRFVEGLMWITGNLLAAYGGVDPSTVEYAVTDVTTGKEVEGYLVDGFAFAPSPDGSHVAYEGYIPHFTPEAEHRPQLCLDHECGLDTPLGPTFARPVPLSSWQGCRRWS
jgi:hypothetical protein